MRTNFENLRVYQLADRIWDIAIDWDDFAKRTVDSQIVRSADSIGANTAEGSGRGSCADNRRFVRTARKPNGEVFVRPDWRQVAAWNGQVGRSTRTHRIVPA